MRRAPRGVGARSNRRRPVVLHALPVRPRASTTSGARGTPSWRRARGTPQQRPLREAFGKNGRHDATEAARTKARSQRHVCSWYHSGPVVCAAPGPRRPLLSQSRSAIRNGLDLRVLGWGVKWEGLSQSSGGVASVEELPADCLCSRMLMMCSSRKGNRPCGKLLTISKRIWFLVQSVGAGRRSRGIGAKRVEMNIHHLQHPTAT